MAVYGLLTVTGVAPRTQKNLLVYARCQCGRVVTVRLTHLKNGHTSSCGCAPNEPTLKHGMARRGKWSPEYRSWRNMMDRCRNPKRPNYAYYGGRGITVCDEWSDFLTFMAHVGPRPAGDFSLDRIDVNGNYEPGNVRWADRVTQQNNLRNSHIHT